ncbi:hypothetical protein HY772_03540 [Candidatus Woesearchaeota archaeon]|nr:hypothetical protein [Candidatus Woesearchaeota archaeon]
MKLSFDEMVMKIKEKTGLSDELILNRVHKKSEELVGLVSKEGAAHIIANELGVDLLQDAQGPCLIKDIAAGMRSVEVVGKVQAIYDVIDFQSQKGPGKVGSFLLADKTGVIRTTCWNAKTDDLKRVKVGDVVAVKNTYARENNGRVEVHLNDRSVLEVNPEGVIVESPVSTSPQGFQSASSLAVRKRIADIASDDLFVEVVGTVVQVFDPHFFEICPQCNKRARPRQETFACDEHGTVAPAYSCVLNLVLDDGSDNIRAVFFREQAAVVLGKSVDDLMLTRASRDALDALKGELMGHMLKVTSKVSQNQMFNRLELVVRSVVRDPDPDEELRLLQGRKQAPETTSLQI